MLFICHLDANAASTKKYLIMDENDGETTRAKQIGIISSINF